MPLYCVEVNGQCQVSSSFPPSFTLWGRVSHWLAMLSVQWALGIHLSWPSQYWYYRFMPQCLLLHGSGEPFSLHSKYLMEGNNLPSSSLSITRRWESRQMCPETIILYRIFLANFIFSLNITCLAMMRSLYLLIQNSSLCFLMTLCLLIMKALAILCWLLWHTNFWMPGSFPALLS